jgi:hypothetical protein
MRRAVWLCVCVLTMIAADASAQVDEPLAPFVFDARGTLARFKEDAGVASVLDVAATNLPTRGLGLTLGGHWYPLRGRRVSLGVGGELIFARGSRTAEPDDDEEIVVQGPTVTTRLSGFSPQVSLNFGKREGWSYVTVGLGRARLTSVRDDEPLSDSAARTRSLNYGGGARWFTGPHLAFTVDLRFYTVNARPAMTGLPAYPRSKMMVISAGISLR